MVAEETKKTVDSRDYFSEMASLDVDDDQADDNSKDEHESSSKRSEKKRNRERLRRSELSGAFDGLAAFITQVDPERAAAADDKKKRRKSAHGGRGSDGEDASGITRLDLIGRAVQVMKNLHQENEERKRVIEQMRQQGGAAGQGQRSDNVRMVFFVFRTSEIVVQGCLLSMSGDTSNFKAVYTIGFSPHNSVLLFFSHNLLSSSLLISQALVMIPHLTPATDDQPFPIARVSYPPGVQLGQMPQLVNQHPDYLARSQQQGYGSAQWGNFPHHVTRPVVQGMNAWHQPQQQQTSNYAAHQPSTGMGPNPSSESPQAVGRQDFI
jgi:hypothetical protein